MACKTDIYAKNKRGNKRGDWGEWREFATFAGPRLNKITDWNKAVLYWRFQSLFFG
jgi:hypothetical protein